MSSEHELRPLSEAIRAEIPGKRNPATEYRWVTKGLAGVNDERIKLQVWYAGRHPCTTRAAVREFVEKVTEARIARMQQRAQLATDVTNEDLEAAGLM